MESEDGKQRDRDDDGVGISESKPASMGMNGGVGEQYSNGLP